MANNVMWLVCTPTGQRLQIARHWMGEWKPLGNLTEDLTRAFIEQAKAGGSADVTPWGSTSWHIEYNRVEDGDDPLVPSCVRTDWEQTK